MVNWTNIVIADILPSPSPHLVRNSPRSIDLIDPSSTLSSVESDIIRVVEEPSTNGNVIKTGVETVKTGVEGTAIAAEDNKFQCECRVNLAEVLSIPIVAILP